ncbi:hypothetical protein ACFYTC_48440 [Actinomadura nitritigenes]|uniref:hypothetical protein n=1 Tax=Actinomadura nitritigenes TaxID=134602 RepID=UPI00368CCFA3
MQVSAFRPPPRVCPYGHRLTAGQVLVGWSPCLCAEATGPRRRGLWGHRTYTCWQCHRYAITSVCYDPPHLGGGHPGRDDARPPRDHTQRDDPEPPNDDGGDEDDEGDGGRSEA